MSAFAIDQGLFGRMCDRVKVRFQRCDDLYALSRGDLSLLASDLGIAENDLREVLPKANDNSLPMDEMMIQRGLDPEKIRHMWGGLARDLEMTCCRCGSVSRCRAELSIGLLPVMPTSSAATRKSSPSCSSAPDLAGRFSACLSWRQPGRTP